MDQISRDATEWVAESFGDHVIVTERASRDLISSINGSQPVACRQEIALSIKRDRESVRLGRQNAEEYRRIVDDAALVLDTLSKRVTKIAEDARKGK